MISRTSFFSLKMARLTMLACAASTWACAPMDDEEGFLDEATAADDSAIIGGAPERGFPAVGRLSFRTDDGNFICSGTLVAPDKVLTAAHCVKGARDWSFTMVDENGRALETISGIRGRSHQTADIATLQLARAAARVTPMRILRDTNVIASGTAVHVVGFGRRDPDGGPLGDKYSVDLTINSVSRDQFKIGSERRGTCAGDSGGPSFVNHRGEWRIAGVHSSVDYPYCRSQGNDVRVDVHAGFINVSDGSTPGGKTTTLRSVASNLCVDVEGGSTGDGAGILQWSCHGGGNQSFTLSPSSNGYHRIVNQATGKCLDVPGASRSDRARIQQWDCHGGENQQFRVEATGDNRSVVRLVARHSNKCLDVPGGRSDMGLNLQQYSCNRGASQQFRLSSPL